MFRSTQVSNARRKRARVIALTVVLSWSLASAGAMAIASSDTWKGRADQASQLMATTSTTTAPAPASQPDSDETDEASAPQTQSPESTTTTSTTAPSTTTTTAAPAPANPTDEQGPQAGSESGNSSGRVGIAAEATGQATPVALQEAQAAPAASNVVPAVAPQPAAAQVAPVKAQPQAPAPIRTAEPAPQALVPVAVPVQAQPAQPVTKGVPAEKTAALPGNFALAEPTAAIGESSPALTWFVVISISLILGLALAATLLYLRSGVIGVAVGPEMSMAGLRNVAVDARLAELQLRRYAARRIRRAWGRVDGRLRPN